MKAEVLEALARWPRREIRELWQADRWDECEARVARFIRDEKLDERHLETLLTFALDGPEHFRGLGALLSESIDRRGAAREALIAVATKKVTLEQFKKTFSTACLGG